MTNYREQKIKNGKFIYPIISIVGNFTKPTNDAPSLLTFDEVETFFHEFGHALHGLLSRCTYPSLSGTNVPRDFVELPSQIMENWVPEPEVLALFAKHYKTNEIIPQSLVQKINNSQLFNQGFATVEYIAASLLDMAYHTQQNKLDEDVMKFEQKYLQKIGLIPEIISRYRTTYFNHIVGGYAAGYYSYIWSGVLDSDAYQAFKENGIFDKKTANSFRQNILEKGNSDDPMTLYKNFRGAEPSIEPLLKKRGLK
jgi:peptidyl-dipeptidase Dcp